MEPTFIETVASIGELLSKPGAYYTTTGQQAYVVVKSLAWHPGIELGQELFFPDGSVLPFTVKTSDREMAPNAKLMSWGTASDYFVRRLESYDRWESAWWREVVQNARDARATRIDLEIAEDTFADPETDEKVQAMRVVCRDNGGGMDAATLEKAFFTRGGSVKEAGFAVGGFGDAKELILSPWLGYEVRSRDLVAHGRHESLYEPGIEAGQPFLQGTEVRVWMPLHRTTSAEHAMQLVERCNLPGIRVFLNGKSISAGLIGGTRVLTSPIVASYETVGELQIYHQPRSQRTGVYIRGNGVYMFELEGFSGSFKGIVYCDVNAPARKVFTRKRDALSYDSNAREQIYAFMRELSVDPMTRLKKERAEKTKMRHVYRGEGAIDVRKGIASEIATKMTLSIPAAKLREMTIETRKNKALTVDKDMIVDLIAVLNQQMEEQKETYEPSRDTPSVDLAPLADAFAASIESLTIFKTEQLAGAMMLAAWKPDLFVYQNLDGYKMPKKLDPANMQPKYVKLLRFWAEMCKYTLLQLGMFKPFGVGWCFDTEMDPDGREMVMGAAYTSEEGMDWLLLNPVKLKKGGGDYEYTEEGDYYDLSNERDVDELCSAVIHEVTHMQGFRRHDQAYAYALTRNIKVALGMKVVAKKILKAVNSAVREETKARKSAAKLTVRFEVDREDVEDGAIYNAKALNVVTGERVGEIDRPYRRSPECTYRWHESNGYERSASAPSYEAAKAKLLKALGAIEEGAQPKQKLVVTFKETTYTDVQGEVEVQRSSAYADDRVVGRIFMGVGYGDTYRYGWTDAEGFDQEKGAPDYATAKARLLKAIGAIESGQETQPRKGPKIIWAKPASHYYAGTLDLADDEQAAAYGLEDRSQRKFALVHDDPGWMIHVTVDNHEERLRNKDGLAIRWDTVTEAKQACDRIVAQETEELEADRVKLRSREIVWDQRDDDSDNWNGMVDGKLRFVVYMSLATGYYRLKDMEGSVLSSQEFVDVEGAQDEAKAILARQA